MSTIAFLPSPIGALLIEDDGACLTSIRILSIDDPPPADRRAPVPGSPGADAARQLAAYFAGKLDRFHLPLRPLGTPRGEALRAAIVGIPAGETLSYGALARIAGSAPRAIGQACARNAFPIIVPCHRVTGSGGAIGHYSGGSGITTKRWLLDHERRGGLL